MSDVNPIPKTQKAYRVDPQWEDDEHTHSHEEMKPKGRLMSQGGAGDSFSDATGGMVICETGNGEAYDAGTFPKKGNYSHQSRESWDHTPNSDKVTDRDGFRRGGNES